MSLADHVDEPPKLPGNKCITCHWYSQLTDEDKIFFDDWIENGWELKQLAVACRKQGLHVADGSFRRHCNVCHNKADA